MSKEAHLVQSHQVDGAQGAVWLGQALIAVGARQRMKSYESPESARGRAVPGKLGAPFGMSL